MANGYQRVIVVGNLGRDPDLRYSQKGTPLTRFSVAAPAALNDGDAAREQTVWYDVTAFNKQAEACNEYLKKGSKVLVEGRLNPVRIYQTESGETRASLPLVADRVQFLSSRGHNSTATSDPAPGEDEADIPF
jgi:single-strand DNA-binding protein